MASFSGSSALLLSVGIFLGSLPLDALAAGIGTIGSKLIIPRIEISRSSKDNGGSLSYPSAEYATHKPYKVDFDLLQASDRSHELEMSVVRSNDIMDDSKDSDDFILASDPTLRSRRRRRRQAEAQQVISAISSDFQRFNLCLPYFNTNSACRQLFYGLTNSNNNNPTSNFVQSLSNPHGHPSALAVPSHASPSNTAFYVPATFTQPSSSISSISSNSVPVVAGGPSVSRNDLAIMNYYQQHQFPHQQQKQQQAPFQQLGIFQGPIPIQRQRPEYDGIHVKYPYPYPPTDIGVQQPVQAVVPESGSSVPENVEAGNSVTTDVPADIAQTTLLPEATSGAGQQDQQQAGAGQQVGADEQDSAAPAQPGHFPDSPAVEQQRPQEPERNVEPVQTTTYNPLPPSSSQPVDVSTAPPSQEQQPPSQGAGGVPVSPDELNDPSSLNQAPTQQLVPVQVHHQVPAQPQQPDLAMQKRLREQEDEIRNLRTQLDQANQQVVSYEQENVMIKDQFMRSEEANIKLRDRVLQLENTNQHLQEQNGQLQQVTAEQRQQINGLKLSVKDTQEQLEKVQNQASPLAQEAQKHQKEIEDFLIRIRKLGEENETCKKQVRLYQLKVNYIMEQQRQQHKQQLEQQQQQQQKQSVSQPQKKKQPLVSVQKTPSIADLTVHDDELDPELSRMDAEIAALQRNADEVAAALQKLPEPPVPQQQEPENLSAPVAAVVAPMPAAANVVEKKENEFPGEAVQVDPHQTKHKHQQEQGQKIATAADVARAESASRNMHSGTSPVWEQPAGF